ncbi:hypothetical protein CXG81DRAFT_17665 [Caulochytrium protostelioides]|uniref:Uncharacterized protein n=1 Tax=Caulochytrium protostelioides TaxID=1555241 RepID=A0A4P9XBE3_9FUNG|nr:hypothetical protein CXG81DRAFT_17665 [Caulochytrium protostelioides]|eukprot:RKP02695.1 hypothetical protein CXG81DRAFT_17665 [Caulochytrium protostelioides]
MISLASSQSTVAVALAAHATHLINGPAVAAPSLPAVAATPRAPIHDTADAHRTTRLAPLTAADGHAAAVALIALFARTAEAASAMAGPSPGTIDHDGAAANRHGATDRFPQLRLPMIGPDHQPVETLAQAIACMGTGGKAAPTSQHVLLLRHLAQRYVGGLPAEEHASLPGFMQRLRSLLQKERKRKSPTADCGDRLAAAAADWIRSILYFHKRDVLASQQCGFETVNDYIMGYVERYAQCTQLLELDLMPITRVILQHQSDIMIMLKNHDEVTRTNQGVADITIPVRTRLKAVTRYPKRAIHHIIEKEARAQQQQQQQQLKGSSLNLSRTLSTLTGSVSLETSLNEVGLSAAVAHEHISREMAAVIYVFSRGRRGMSITAQIIGMAHHMPLEETEALLRSLHNFDTWSDLYVDAHLVEWLLRVALSTNAPLSHLAWNKIDTLLKGNQFRQYVPQFWPHFTAICQFTLTAIRISDTRENIVPEMLTVVTRILEGTPENDFVSKHSEVLGEIIRRSMDIEEAVLERSASLVRYDVKRLGLILMNFAYLRDATKRFECYDLMTLVNVLAVAVFDDRPADVRRVLLQMRTESAYFYLFKILDNSGYTREETERRAALFSYVPDAMLGLIATPARCRSEHKRTVTLIDACICECRNAEISLNAFLTPARINVVFDLIEKAPSPDVFSRLLMFLAVLGNGSTIVAQIAHERRILTFIVNQFRSVWPDRLNNMEPFIECMWSMARGNEILRSEFLSTGVVFLLLRATSESTSERRQKLLIRCLTDLAEDEAVRRQIFSWRAECDSTFTIYNLVVKIWSRRAQDDAVHLAELQWLEVARGALVSDSPSRALSKMGSSVSIGSSVNSASATSIGTAGARFRRMAQVMSTMTHRLRQRDDEFDTEGRTHMLGQDDSILTALYLFALRLGVDGVTLSPPENAIVTELMQQNDMRTQQEWMQVEREILRVVGQPTAMDTEFLSLRQAAFISRKAMGVKFEKLVKGYAHQREMDAHADFVQRFIAPPGLGMATVDKRP